MTAMLTANIAVTILYMTKAGPVASAGAAAGSTCRLTRVAPIAATSPPATASSILAFVSPGLINFWFFNFLPFGAGSRGAAPGRRKIEKSTFF